MHCYIKAVHDGSHGVLPRLTQAISRRGITPEHMEYNNSVALLNGDGSAMVRLEGISLKTLQQIERDWRAIVGVTVVYSQEIPCKK